MNPESITCPRCHVKGRVKPDRYGTFTVQWANGGRDLNVMPEDLRDPTYGCGRDGVRK